jgi:hypothetical protein
MYNNKNFKKNFTWPNLSLRWIPISSRAPAGGSTAQYLYTNSINHCINICIIVTAKTQEAAAANKEDIGCAFLIYRRV